MARLPSVVDLMSMLKDHSRRLRKLETAAGLGNSAIGAGGLIIRNNGAVRSEDFAAGATGYRLQGDSAEFNDLTLRGGIIGNDALTSPVHPQVNRLRTNDFPITTTETTRLSLPIPIPAGYTKALILALVRATGFNDTLSPDMLYVGVDIPGEVNIGYQGQGAAESNWSASAVGDSVGLTTGLTSASTITADARILTRDANWSTSPGNTLTLSAMTLFLR